jgi:hypothetical protein
MATSVAARLGERLGLDLPSYALFAAPTPAEMVELVAGQPPFPRHIEGCIMARVL